MTSEKALFSKYFTSNLRDIFIRTKLWLIPTNLATNMLLFCFCPFEESKNRIIFPATWWFGKKKYFCFYIYC